MSEGIGIGKPQVCTVQQRVFRLENWKSAQLPAHGDSSGRAAKGVYFHSFERYKKIIPFGVEVTNRGFSFSTGPAL